MCPPSMIPNQMSIMSRSGDFAADVGMKVASMNVVVVAMRGVMGLTGGSNISSLGARKGTMVLTPIIATSMAQALPQQHQLQHLQHIHQLQQHQQQQQMRQWPLPLGALPEAALHMDSDSSQMRASTPPAIPRPNITGQVVKTHGDVLTGAPNSGAAAASSSSSLPSPSKTSPIQNQFPPLPEDVELDPATTEIIHVPLTDKFKPIPKISDKEISEIQGWVGKEYEDVLRKKEKRMVVEMRDMFGGAMWWEKGSPDVDVNGWKREHKNFEVRYPLRRGEETQEGKDRRTRQREGLRLPRKLEPGEADRPEELVPIRLEFDVEHHKMKLKDTFVWNLNDPVVTPEAFAQSIVDDYALASSYHTVIVKSIQEQLSDYKTHSLSHDQDSGEFVVDLKSETPILQGTLDDSHAQWWEAWKWRTRHIPRTATEAVGSVRSKKRQKLDVPVATMKMKGEEKNVAVFDSMDVDEEDEFGRPMTTDEIELDEGLMREEMRILIKLSIIVGTTELEDQFEWDLENDTVTPEQFSEVYARDLGLGGEFKTAIAHCIREQVQMYRKSLFFVSHPSNGTPIQNEELRQAFLPNLTTGTRPLDQRLPYTPVLNTVSDSDVERSERKREKEMNKRKKRNQHGYRGAVIPDRESVRTHRTPAIGFPEIDSATLMLAAAVNAPSSRRAAAIAASSMIANMIAFESEITYISAPSPLPTTTRPQPMKEKEREPKGLFKAPATPSAVPPLSKNNPPITIPLPTLPLKPKIKIVPKKPAKELKQLREAVEKEFIDGQYPNWINGVWHCSNCGCPKSMTFARRRGPLGDKSQCGLCGKFWHRHRRPRPVEYNPDPGFHTRKSSDSKPPARRRAAALRTQSTAATAAPLDVPTQPTIEIAQVNPNDRHNLKGLPYIKFKGPNSPESTSSNGSSRSIQPSSTNTTPRTLSRAVDEDYDEGVADALMGLAGWSRTGAPESSQSLEGHSHSPTASVGSNHRDPSPRGNKRKADDSASAGPSGTNGQSKPNIRREVPPVTPEEMQTMLIDWLKNAKGEPTTRECIQRFAPYLTDQAKKQEFSKLVRRVATLQGTTLVLRSNAASAAHGQPKPKKRREVPPVTPGEMQMMLIDWLKNAKGEPTTRECIQHFAPYLTDQVKKQEFSKLVRRIATLRGTTLVLRSSAAYAAPSSTTMTQ